MQSTMERRVHVWVATVLVMLWFLTPAVAAAQGFTFYLSGNMTTERDSPTLTLLPNGKVLVAGGYDGAYLRSAELYDPATGLWTVTGNMNETRAAHTATLLPSGLVLVAGGTNGPSILATAELYDPSTGHWTPTGNMTSTRWVHRATLLSNGKVLVWGRSGVSAELYNPGTGTWSATGSMLSGHDEGAAVLLSSGKVLVAGGHGSSQAELYNPTTGIWNATGSMTVARAEFRLTMLTNGQVLAAGGPGTSAELYNPAAGVWHATGGMGSGRRYFTATRMPNGQVLVTGGDGGGSTAELYDPSTGTWSRAGDMHVARWLHAAELLANGQVMVAGGRGAGTSTELGGEASGSFSISGSTTDTDGQPIAGVTISAGGGRTATTNSSGNYALTGLITGTYTLIPSRSGYTFSPPQRLVAVSGGNVTGQDFTGVPNPEPAPLTLIADSGYASIKLSWNAATDPHVTAYRVRRAPSGSQAYSTVAAVSQLVYFDQAGLSLNATYCYRVDAMSASGDVVVTSNQACATYGQLVIWVPDTWGAPGQTAIVPVNIRNAQGLRLAATDIWLDYDGTVIEPVVISRTALTAEYAWSFASSGNGADSRVRIAAITSPGQEPTLYGDGSLFWLTFRVQGTQDMTSPLNLREFIDGVGGSTIYDPRDTFNAVPLRLQDGIFRVGAAYLLGDLNGNGVIQAIDAYIALQVASGQVTPSWQQRMAGDVNGDGAVDAADASMILYYAAHGVWPTPDVAGAAVQQVGNAASGPIFSLTSVNGLPGSMVTTTLRADNLANWAGGRVVITFNPALVGGVVGIQPTGLAKTAQVSFRADASGVLRIALATGTPLSGSGAMADIRLRIAPRAPLGLATPLTLAEVKANDVLGRDYATSALQKIIERRHAILRVGRGWISLPIILK